MRNEEERSVGHGRQLETTLDGSDDERLATDQELGGGWTGRRWLDGSAKLVGRRTGSVDGCVADLTREELVGTDTNVESEEEFGVGGGGGGGGGRWRGRGGGRGV